MWFLLLGVVGIVLKYFELSFVAQMPWWQVLVPFGLAVGWWAWADAFGYTKRKVMQREDKRRNDRIERQRSQLGMLTSRSSQKKRRR